eukprot:CAMPEP_0114991374 /NCGR_PEP_ID=MMETSP0216-20121206/11331_1 /TAXON_ID=223996 /ORGANISM="Protocruzia adherens, Strain Boccale" /LENGTH=603 /DNA_ID=CAMNT_0002354683 /DNA_START=1 /DNA_END=1813 /DNA_ORIENTATION=-
MHKRKLEDEIIEVYQALGETEKDCEFAAGLATLLLEKRTVVSKRLTELESLQSKHLQENQLLTQHNKLLEGEIEKKNKHVSQLEEKLNEAESQVNTMFAENQSYLKQVQTLSVSEKHHKKLLDRQQSENDDIKGYQIQMEEYVDQIGRYEGSLSQATETIKSLNEQLVLLKNQNDEFEQQCKLLTTEKGNLEEDVVRLQKDLNETAEYARAKKSEVGDLQEELVRQQETYRQKIYEKRLDDEFEVQGYSSDEERRESLLDQIHNRVDSDSDDVDLVDTAGDDLGGFNFDGNYGPDIDDEANLTIRERAPSKKKRAAEKEAVIPLLVTPRRRNDPDSRVLKSARVTSQSPEDGALKSGHKRRKSDSESAENLEADEGSSLAKELEFGTSLADQIITETPTEEESPVKVNKDAEPKKSPFSLNLSKLKKAENETSSEIKEEKSDTNTTEASNSQETVAEIKKTEEERTPENKKAGKATKSPVAKQETEQERRLRRIAEAEEERIEPEENRAKSKNNNNNTNPALSKAASKALKRSASRKITANKGKSPEAKRGRPPGAGRKDPIEEFFILTTQAVKLNSPYMDPSAPYVYEDICQPPFSVFWDLA